MPFSRPARIDVTRMTVCDAMGYARQRGQLETYRGHEYKTNLLRKIGARDRCQRRLRRSHGRVLGRSGPHKHGGPYRRRKDIRRAHGASHPNQRRLSRQGRNLNHAQVVLFSNDLTVLSRVDGAATRLGKNVRSVSTAAQLGDCRGGGVPELLIVDLATPSLEIEPLVAQWKLQSASAARIVAFGTARP